MTDSQKSIFDMPAANYLRDLAERLRHIPVMYGVDGGDIDRLSEIAAELELNTPNSSRTT